MTFDDPAMAERLEALDEAGLGALGFGAVRLDEAGRVTRYNLHEQRRSGLSLSHVSGRRFFSEVAPCMNNYLVAERLDEAALDVTMPYVLTFRMRLFPVRLRLIRTPASRHRWVLVLDV